MQPSRSRDRISVHIRFETKQLQSTANNVVAELRVYKNSLPMRAIARMMVAGCYSSDVIVGLQVASGEVVSRLVLSARDLATSSWVPFHNLSGLYNGWVQNQSEQEMILKIAILSGSCNSNRVVLNAFASPFAEHHSPVLLLYSNDSTNDLQARNVDSSSPNRLAAANDHRLARDVAPGACRLQFHHVSAWERVDRYESYRHLPPNRLIYLTTFTTSLNRLSIPLATVPAHATPRRTSARALGCCSRNISGTHPLSLRSAVYQRGTLH